MTLKEFLTSGDRFAAENGITLDSVTPGHATASLKVEKRHLNAGGVCQGGAIFTLADLVFAALVNQGTNLTFSINSTVYYLAPAKEGDILTATGNLIFPHHRLPAVEVKVTNGEGTLIALFTGQASSGKMPNGFSGLE